MKYLTIGAPIAPPVPPKNQVHFLIHVESTGDEEMSEWPDFSIPTTDQAAIDKMCQLLIGFGKLSGDDSASMDQRRRLPYYDEFFTGDHTDGEECPDCGHIHDPDDTEDMWPVDYSFGDEEQATYEGCSIIYYDANGQSFHCQLRDLDALQ